MGILLQKPENVLANLEKLYDKIRDLILQSSPRFYSFHRIVHYTTTPRVTGFRCTIIIHMQARNCKELILAFLEKQNKLNKTKAHPDRLFA